jgi:SAM-dependent methyltransferase
MDDFALRYADYYGDPRLQEWRDLGARAKAANIIALWPRGSPPENVAEIGFGDGAVLAQLDRLGFGEALSGFEVSASAVEAASQREFQRPVTLVEFDGVRIPAGDDEFDLAILSHVVEHVAEPRAAIHEAARIARHVFVEVPTELHARTPRHFAWTELGHINLYSPLLIRHLVESCNLEILGERVTHSPREVCCFRDGRLRGSLKWAVKAAALRVGLGTQLFTYHCSLIAVPHS